MKKRLFLVFLVIFLVFLVACTNAVTTQPVNSNKLTNTETPESTYVVCDHNWKDSTCTLPKTCINCGLTEGEPLGHDYKMTNTKEATCTEVGTKTYTCTKCGTVYTENISANGHKWQDASCTEPKKCTTCGFVEGDALGHTTDCGICSRCGMELYKLSPVTITGFRPSKDSVGGVTLHFSIRNNTSKQIKYVYLKFIFYNAVGDLVRDEITWENYQKVKFTGPLDAYSTSTPRKTTTKFYNYSCDHAGIAEIKVDYMDGTTETVTEYHYDYAE